MTTTPIRFGMTLATFTVLLAATGCQTTQLPTAQNLEPTKSVMPSLMYQDGRAEEAMNRYVEVFREARVHSVKKYGENQIGAEPDSVEQAVFEVYGQRIMVTDSPIRHAFGFTPSVALLVDLDSEPELDRIFAALSEGGDVMMPPANYGFSEKFAWIQDRYGVSWQLNLSPAPSD